MASISFASINIERSKHLHLVLPFLKKVNPEVICLQELMEYDISRFEQELGIRIHFVPNTRHPAEGRPGNMGVGIGTVLPVENAIHKYYWGDETVHEFREGTDPVAKHNAENRTILSCDIIKDGATFRVATTHFTWTPNGQVDDMQREDLANMLPILEELGEFALCGDFNAPRGGEIFSAIAARYKDNIPETYDWSLDLDLHRGGHDHMNSEAQAMGLKGLMVDGLFTTPRYQASNVEVHTGVSDHCAVTATISTGV